MVNGPVPAVRGVYNLSQGWWQKFEIYFEGVGPNCIERRPGGGGKFDRADVAADVALGCTYRNVAYPVALDSGETEFLQELHAFYIASGATLKEVIAFTGSDLNLPPCSFQECVNPGTSAYDVSRNIGVSQRVREATVAALANRSAARRIMDNAAAMVDIHFFGADLAIEVRVTFADGSVVLINVTEAVPGGTIEHTLDPSGNAVWEVGGGQEGTFTLPTHDNVADFLDHARRIFSERSGYACGSDGGTGVICRRINS